MSWRRKVHCHYCYETGHNRRTCPKLQEHAQQNPDSRQAREVANRANRGNERACRYCQGQGHNRKTCQKLMNDCVGALDKNQKWRKHVLGEFKRLGIGLGTLINLNSTWNGHHILMVEEIRWDNILYQNGDLAIIVNDHGVRDYKHSFIANQEFFNLLDAKNENFQIVVPASEENIGVGIPKDWENGMSNIEKAFSHWNDR